MKGSSKMMREQAERAFDEVFGRPPGSKELGKHMPNSSIEWTSSGKPIAVSHEEICNASR